MRRINCNDRVIIDSIGNTLNDLGIAGPMRMAYIDLVKRACKMCGETKLSLEEIRTKLMEEGQKWGVNKDVLTEILKVLTPWCSQ
jgi:hypothetical protein